MDALVTGHEIKVLLYNSQTPTPITQRVRTAAEHAGIPVVAMTETLPPHRSFQQWQLGQAESAVRGSRRDERAGPPVVSAEGLGLRFGERVLWDDLSFALATGELLAVLGPNGTGKTSLIRIMLGLLDSLGRAHRDRTGSSRAMRAGASATCHSSACSTAILPCAARDLVRLGVDGHRWGIGRLSSDERARVERALSECRRIGLRDAPIGRLSGGEQQRLRIAQALVSDPVLLLADEPLLSLDLAYQQTITHLLDERRRSAGTPVVFVTHDINPVLPMVDRVLYLAPGRWAIGTPDEVLTSETLSALYDTDVDVLRVRDRIVVVGTPDDSARPPRRARHTDVHGSARPALRAHRAARRRRRRCRLRSDRRLRRHARRELRRARDLRARIHRRSRQRSSIGIDPVIGLVGGSLGVGLVLGLLSLRGRETRQRDRRGARVRSRCRRAAPLALPGICNGGDQPALRQHRRRQRPPAAACSSSSALIVLAGLAGLYRPLLFSSVDPDLAEARGVPLRALAVATFLLLALATAEAVQVVGVLLVLTLVITPAAAAQRLTVRPGRALLLSVAIALVSTEGGILLSLAQPWPTTLLHQHDLLRRVFVRADLRRDAQLSRPLGQARRRARSRRATTPRRARSRRAATERSAASAAASAVGRGPPRRARER